jgi:hypothetical protein
MIIKLDMANAFNRVCHRFFIEVHRKFGFGSNFIKWIMAFTSSPWIAPLVNGHPIAFFKASGGLRQGCRLSHLLNILMEKALSRKLEHQHMYGNIPKLKIVKCVKNSNNSQAYDTLLLGAKCHRNTI